MIPKFKAKIIDSDEFVEGFYMNNRDINPTHLIFTEDRLWIEINIDTLEISFDDGVSWRKI